jgi:hypothetical protein
VRGDEGTRTSTFCIQVQAAGRARLRPFAQTPRVQAFAASERDRIRTTPNPALLATESGAESRLGAWLSSGRRHRRVSDHGGRGCELGGCRPGDVGGDHELCGPIDARGVKLSSMSGRTPFAATGRSTSGGKATAERHEAPSGAMGGLAFSCLTLASGSPRLLFDGGGPSAPRSSAAGAARARRSACGSPAAGRRANRGRPSGARWTSSTRPG